MRVVLALLVSISLLVSGLCTSRSGAGEDSDLRAVHRLGKEEVISLPALELLEFLWNRYYRGALGEFHYFGANPTRLTKEELKKPATILIHASESNQGQWYDLLNKMQMKGNLGAVFTFNYKDGQELKALEEKIKEIKALYRSYGINELPLNLVGHSLGGIAAAEYAFSDTNWVKGTKVYKVITIASRLKNRKIVSKTPFYEYCKDVLYRIENLYPKIEQNGRDIQLYTIAAEKDWLVPKESSLVAKERSHTAIIPNVGHVQIPSSPEATEQVVNWLAS